MVTNSLGKRNFMPANGKAQACTQGALLFFLISFGRGGDKDFFSFFLGSQWVPIRFPICSPFLNVFPNMFSIAPHFYPICFGKCFPPFTYIVGSSSILQNRTLEVPQLVPLELDEAKIVAFSIFYFGSWVAYFVLPHTFCFV